MAENPPGEQQLQNQTGLEVFLLRSLPVKKRHFKPENVSLKRTGYKRVEVLGSGVEPVYQLLQPVFGIRQECRDGEFGVHVDYEVGDVSVLKESFFDGRVKGLRFQFEFQQQSFSPSDLTNRPKPKLFTLTEDENWLEVSLKNDKNLWHNFWRLEGLGQWIKLVNGCESAGVEITKQYYRVVLDGKTIFELTDYHRNVNPTNQDYSLCSWVEKLDGLSNLDPLNQRDVLLQKYYTIEVLNCQFRARHTLKSQLQELVKTKQGLLRVEFSGGKDKPCTFQSRDSLASIFDGMADGYYAPGLTTKMLKMEEFQATCKQLSVLVKGLSNHDIQDSKFIQVEAEITNLITQWTFHFIYNVDYNLILEQTAKNIEELDPNFGKCRYLIKALCDFSILRFFLNFTQAVEYGPTLAAIRDQRIQSIEPYLFCVRGNYLEFWLSCPESNRYSIPLPEHITRDGISQIMVLAFKSNQILVQNSKLKRKVFILVDLDLAYKCVSSGVPLESGPMKQIFYRRSLPPVIRNHIWHKHREGIEPAAIFISTKGITTLHKEYLVGSGLIYDTNCVRKLALSYIRPKLLGKRRNWLQIDIKGLHKHKWAYWYGHMEPAILTYERHCQIFVATEQTILGISAEPQPRKEIAELECYSVDWAARTIKLSVAANVPVKTSPKGENLQEWRLVRGIVFYMFFQRTPRLVWLYCFHRGAFVPAGKQTTVAQPMDLGSLGVEELHFVTDGPVQGYAVGRQVKGETADGHMVHRFFRIQPTF